ncbi:MAG: molybdopterin-guanine dinucleotide biosynthesis protein B [Rhodospirillales bacterium]
MKVFSLVGSSGSGKTTLVVKLLPELIGRGYKVSTMKHTHHKFDIDTDGKDSQRHRRAGAFEVLLTSSSRWVLMHEHRGAPEPRINEIIAKMEPVDLLLIEGFKEHPHPKMEVHRPAAGKPLMRGGDQTVVAVASDQAVEGLGVPLLDLNDVVAIADFIVDYCRLEAR